MILVVGGAGYLGSHISSLLGSRCTVYDTLLYRDEFLADIPFVYGDVTNHDLLKHWLDRADAVIWLAAIVGDGACSINPGRTRRANVDAVQFLADTFSGPIIFTSTASVYGASGTHNTEESILKPLSLYAHSKVKAEQILADSNALILRLGTLHGFSDRMRFDLVVNVMTRDAVTKSKITVFGGNQYRPLLHVADAAKYICDWIQGGWEPGIVNFATQNLTIKQVARLVKSNVFGTEIVYTENEFEDKRDYSMQVSFAGLGIGDYRGVDLSVIEIASVLREGRIKDPYSDRYVNAKALPRI